jgi:hypothetical protein
MPPAFAGHKSFYCNGMADFYRPPSRGGRCRSRLSLQALCTNPSRDRGYPLRRERLCHMDPR